MNRSILILCCCLLATGIWAQSSQLIFKGTSPLSVANKATMPALDNAALSAKEMALRAPGRAPKFAKVIEVDINTANSGVWEEVGDQSIWRLQIESLGAHSINLGLTKFHLPSGGSFIVYDPSETEVLGPFTASDNEVHNQLWTPVFAGDQIVLEVVVPTVEKSALDFHLAYVNHDFMGFNSLLSGSCNLDVICGEADGWGIVDGYRDIIRSVATIGTGGDNFCTGFLINNVNNDGTPYFMTASHCDINFSNSPSLVVYWNYQNSTCRQPNTASSGADGDGQKNIFNTGSVFAAGYGPSDFVLVELDDPIHPDAAAFMAGFTIDPNPPTDTIIGIHHPSNEEKRISFEFDETHIGAWGSGGAMVPDGNHIVVPDWDIGTTEGGSSGSPLFDKNKRVVGQLHGGAAACGNNGWDSYGWFYSSWVGGGTVGTRLSDFLDPDNTGTLTIDGLDLDVNIKLNTEFVSFCAPQDQTFELSISPLFTDDVALTLTPAPPAGVGFSFSNDNPAPGESVTLTFTNTESFDAGSHSFTIDATDGMTERMANLQLDIYTNQPNEVSLLFPTDEFDEALSNQQYSWEDSPNASLYDFQIATDPDFTNILSTITDIEENSTLGPNLDAETTYYWRVRGVSPCGIGSWSTVFSFTRAEISCLSAEYNGGAVEIPTQTSTVTATQAITLDEKVTSVKVVDLDIAHTFVGDLIVTLISSAGTEVILFDKIGFPENDAGCSGENLLLSFDDEASATAEELNNTCEGPPAFAAQGTFQPVDPLAIFANESALGEWTIQVEDIAFFDGGALQGFTLEICSFVPDTTAITELEELSITVAPNPVANDVKISLSESTKNEVALRLLQLDGRLLSSKTIERGGLTTTFDMSNLPQGLYLLEIESNGSAYTEKLIKL